MIVFEINQHELIVSLNSGCLLIIKSEIICVTLIIRTFIFFLMDRKIMYHDN